MTRFTVGAQPSVSQVERLEDEGFRAIVNLRTEGEEDQPMSPEAETMVVDSGVAEVVRRQEAGWAYLKSGG